jgi:hypothetical protein
MLEFFSMYASWNEIWAAACLKALAKCGTLSFGIWSVVPATLIAATTFFLKLKTEAPVQRCARGRPCEPAALFFALVLLLLASFNLLDSVDE